MDTLVGDLTELINKHLDIVNSILLGNTENFDLTGNKKWMVYYVNSNDEGFYRILETLDLKTLRFLETHKVRDDRDFDIFTALIKKMLSLGLVKNAVRFMFKLGIHYDEVWFLLRTLIKHNHNINRYNKEIKIITELCMVFHRAYIRDNNHDDPMSSKLIEYIYHYGDHDLIKHYEQSVFANEENELFPDDIHLRYKFIGLVKSGQNVDALFDRFNGDGGKVNRYIIIYDLLKYEHNDIVIRLLAQFEGDTTKDQIITMTRYLDVLLKPIYPTLMSLYRRAINNLEMYKIIAQILLEDSDTSVLNDMLDGAIRNNRRDVYDMILDTYPLLAFSVSLNRILLKSETDPQFLKHILDRRGGINQEELRIITRLLLDDGNIRLLELAQNYK